LWSKAISPQTASRTRPSLVFTSDKIMASRLVWLNTSWIANILNPFHYADGIIHSNWPD